MCIDLLMFNTNSYIHDESVSESSSVCREEREVNANNSLLQNYPFEVLYPYIQQKADAVLQILDLKEGKPHSLFINSFISLFH